MKLRQKLAMVLATAMVVTAVPVTTMAASSNSFSKTITVADGTDITTGLHLIVDYTDTVANDEFYLTAEDFDFDGKYKAGVLVYGDLAETKVVGTATLINDEIKVEVHTATEKVYIPVFGEVDKGTPSITVDAKGSFATTSTLTFGEVTSDTTLKATVDGATTISIDETVGTIGDIVIEELVAGSLEELVGGEKITITLPNKSDLVFTATQTIKVTGSRGQAGITATAAPNSDDNKVLEITVTSADDTKLGTMTIEGITVEPEGKTDNFEEGEIEVEVAAKDALDDTDLVVAEIVEEGVTIEVDEEVELTAGHGDETVTIVVSQAALGSLDGDAIYFDIDGAEIVEVESDDVLFDKKDSDEFSIAQKTEVEDGETVLVEDDEYEIDVTLRAKASEEGEITVTAESRALEDDVEITLGEVVPGVTVETETLVFNPNVNKNVGGKIVLTEKDSEDFAKNTEFYIEAEYHDIEDAEIEVTGGDIEISSKVDNGYIKITIDRESDEASEITISDIEVESLYAYAEGEYDLYVFGDAVSDQNETDTDNEQLTVEGFFATTNAVEAEQAEVVLQIGNAAYTVDGEAKTAETAPFIDPATNRTMAPVRAVAEAFGCELDFFFPEGSDQLVITLTKGDKHVQFQNGSNIMVVDGGQFIMSATAQIKDGYTFVPVSFLAQALSIGCEWDGATQTIVFGN